MPRLQKANWIDCQTSTLIYYYFLQAGMNVNLVLLFSGLQTWLKNKASHFLIQLHKKIVRIENLSFSFPTIFSDKENSHKKKKTERARYAIRIKAWSSINEMAKIIKKREKTHLPIIREKGLPVLLQFHIKQNRWLWVRKREMWITSSYLIN